MKRSSENIEESRSFVKIASKSLDEAIYKASLELECSVSEIEYEVIQKEKKGILGFGKKDAIIVASSTTLRIKKETIVNREPMDKKSSKKSEAKSKKSSYNSNSATQDELEDEKIVKKDSDISKDMQNSEDERVKSKSVLESRNYSTNSIIDNFHKDIEKIAKEVEDEVNRIFSYCCYDIERIVVSAQENNTLYIEFSGQDSALLIGKEGYRYKALSYMLFNWVSTKYEGVMIKLEIAEFLKNQEEMIRGYLVSVIDHIEEFGKGQTRPLDGVLAHIALRLLRERFPNKYVSFRYTSEGEKFVVINDFYSTQNRNS